MIEKCIKILVKSNIIKSEEQAIYQYGLNLLVKKILHILIILLFGAICGYFASIIFFLIAYAGIREYAGGYHAKTTKGCYCCTGIVTICSVVLFHVFQCVGLTGSFLILLICGVVIWCLAPQETANRPLDKQDKILYKKLSRKYLLGEGMICLLIFVYRPILNGIVCAWLIESIMLLVGQIEEKCR